MTAKMIRYRLASPVMVCKENTLGRDTLEVIVSSVVSRRYEVSSQVGK
jgi:hypothetical protein